MREVDGRVFIDKEEVARRLINSAIRNVFQGECPVATHVLIGSATTLMEEYAKSLGKELKLDIERYAKPEHVSGLKAAMKSHYNFFKHANHDAGMSIDVSNISETNEFGVWGAVIEFWNLFHAHTPQMLLYFSVFSILRPELFDWQALSETHPEVATTRNSMADWSRDRLFTNAREALDHGPNEAEKRADMAPIYHSEVALYDGPPHRDMFKRTFESQE